jgi:hypothetical protein
MDDINLVEDIRFDQMNYSNKLSELSESGFYLENLTFKNISDFEMDDDFTINSFKMRLNRVHFEGLEPAAIMKLKHFVEIYSVSGG